MRCPEAKKLLSARRDGPLPPEQVALLADHLSACSSCARYDRQLARIPDALGARATLSAPAGFTAATMRRLIVAHPQRVATTRLPGRVGPAEQLAFAAIAALFVTLSATGPLLLRWLGLADTVPQILASLLTTGTDALATAADLLDIAGTLTTLLFPSPDLALLATNSAAVIAAAITLWLLTLWPALTPREPT